MNTTAIIISITVLSTGVAVSVVTIFKAFINAKKAAEDKILKGKQQYHSELHAIKH